ncbi:protein STICHEL-like 2 isoform X1 [Ziziphus jujuba]|uniref:DNA-directed DNA polymerase n=1 Tax=Ziziphus jujuba TaxID=326968 RepID=A0A6P6G4Y9_ZIZJJ|nr:protein STICHEL-like 2 isoform X1 [Ziziphus jujuba]XP_024929086.3 protein STICHEL-like 2 isoform X1 [Ziziphus jujuba]
MTDGRRHSVDIPISKTLVALRRVRSLRDPSTNSMSKFSSSIDNANWDTNSSNGISLGFLDSCQQGISSKNHALRPKKCNLYGQREEYMDDYESSRGLGKSLLNLYDNSGWDGGISTPFETEQAEGLGDSESYEEENLRNKALSERNCNCKNHIEKGLDLTCITHGKNPLEDVDSYDEPAIGSVEEGLDHIASKRNFQCKNQVKLSGAVGDVMSRMSSPYPSTSDVVSSHDISLFTKEDVDVEDHNDRGCGISCCWSRTPRFRGDIVPSDVEGRPLLWRNLDDLSFYENRNLKHSGSEIISHSETPRSLSQKFRPKSFNELVGQNVVARSLLGAISRGRLTSFYLFHGPRGTGKTSASRIFAAALNCLSLEEHRPCGLCRECVSFFSGRSKDVKEVDSVRINRRDRVRYLIKNALIPPASSRFKVFIIDECHLLHGETWATVLNSLDNLSQHVIFVMITPNLDKLPRSAVARSQRYHFPKIRDADIASRLGRICVEEGLDFDQAALDFIAAKSNGSLRDAEMMLDQLSLLGRKITMSLAYELIGIVSDDELLDLLDLALSSDTSNTVLRARELMRSRIDPMQLISQLANLVMDILVGNCQEGCSEVRRKFHSKHNSEVDLQKLGHALKILSETEKQLRMSKNQTTWLTVALLQLSSVEVSSLDVNNSKLWLGNAHDKGKRCQHLVGCSCEDCQSHKLGMQDDCKGPLESIWKRATELCRPTSLKNFLEKQGKLSSLFVSKGQGLAVAELEFCHPDYVSKAEKSWKLIVNSLQSILDCNVEIRINLVPCPSNTKHVKVNKQSFSLFSCSRRMQKSQSTTEHASDSDYSEYTSEKPMISDKSMLPSSSCCGSQMPHNCCSKMEVIKTLRNDEGNVPRTSTSSHRSLGDYMPNSELAIAASNEQANNNHRGHVLCFREPENQPNCFSRLLRLQKKLRTSETSQMICCSQLQNGLTMSQPRKSYSGKFLSANNSSVPCSCSNTCTSSTRDENELREESEALCWRTRIYPPRKACQTRHQRQDSHSVGWVLPCGTVK